MRRPSRGGRQRASSRPSGAASASRFSARASTAGDRRLPAVDVALHELPGLWDAELLERRDARARRASALERIDPGRLGLRWLASGRRLVRCSSAAHDRELRPGGDCQALGRGDSDAGGLRCSSAAAFASSSVSTARAVRASPRSSVAARRSRTSGRNLLVDREAPVGRPVTPGESRSHGFGGLGVLDFGIGTGTRRPLVPFRRCP